ncbi:MAG: NAD-glutamate dehydrogenase [Steroidobacteraceae bacterium]
MVGKPDPLHALPTARRKILRAILNSVTKQAPKTGSQQLTEFILAYYGKVEDADLQAHSARQLAATALQHFQLGQRRRPGQTLLQVHNPEPVTHAANTVTHTLVTVIADDLPFLVDSICMAFSRFGLNVHLIVHPVLLVQRTAKGQWRHLADAEADDACDESWQRYEIDRISDPAKLEQLQQDITAALRDVARACRDWHAMRERACALCRDWQQQTPPIKAVEVQEATAFMHWLADNHFTFLGSQQFKLKRGSKHDDLQPLPETALGLMKAGSPQQAQAVRLTGELRDAARLPQLLLITKSGSMATVHRAAHLDHISVKHIDRQGRVIGETRFLGLFTSNVYTLNPREIPLLQHKLERVVAAIGFATGSHDAKAVQHVIDNYPRDELFQSSVEQLAHTVRGIVSLYERRRVRLFLRRDVFKRFYSCLLYLPRDRYNTQVRERIEGHLLAALSGSDVESQVMMSDSALARLHLLIRTPGDSARSVDIAALETDVTHLIRTWHDELNAALLTRHGETIGQTLRERYHHAFPAAYQADVAANEALSDIDQLEKVVESIDSMELRLTDSLGHLHLRLIRRSTPLPLSDVLPMLENLGLRVLTERPYEIEPQRSKSLWIQDFELEPSRDINVVSVGLNDLFHDAFLAIWQGRVENDGFNRLIIKALLGWREVNVLRAYCRYLLQTGLNFSQRYMETTLVRHAQVSTKLWQLFATRFDPTLKDKQRNQRLQQLNQEVMAELDKISSPDEDRILRSYLTVINASVRTNYFQRDAEGKPKTQLSFKLRSTEISHLPAPKPMFEIFVHSPRVEGVHLRMGAVARGGLRWSDRREDFRTEVLGLMKAQNVKNSVIVPVGAKGGFVPKQIAAGAPREEVQREGIECYRSFVRGLLDITDNIVNGKIVPPAGMVRHDAVDPYLVVAADKGTATFSDIANNVAAEYNFWLGDAFASGGSAGYDHKKMAITARGAWECVKRHCREIGLDVDRQTFTVCGIGDMAGDVFGNGMLRSPHMKLLAAFNHQHIFIDPNPDPATSFKERQRLFNLPRSTWEDYEPKLISRGGGVYSRSAKSIALTTEAQQALGANVAAITPTELIRVILRMPVDLLWNGGIGTYVKASHETHPDAGDRSNDAVRINGNELRCKVVGEGGNLGFTQRGRVEYALAGGRLNTDFIDNSAGVDCSDHEVNIKILLSLANKRSLPAAKRQKLLFGMTDAIAELVLRDNYLQSQALSMSEQVAVARLQEHAHLIRSLEQSYGLDRALEGLPDAEAIAQRQQDGHGLTRPELAVLLSYSKMALFKHLIGTDIAGDPYLALELQRYFPVTLSKRFAKLLPRHRLAREIITTAITNSMVNRMGPSFAMRTEEETGADAARIARAYTIAREIFGARELWSQIEALDNRVPAAVQYQMMNASVRLLRLVTYWLLNHCGEQLHIQQQVARLQSGINELANQLARVLPDNALSPANLQMRQTWQSAGVPQKLAQQVAHLEALGAGPDIVELGITHRRSIIEVAKLYFDLEEHLSLAWLRQQITGLKTTDRWQTMARNTLRDQLYSLQRNLCGQILQRAGKASTDKAIAAWQSENVAVINSTQQALKDIQAGTQVDFAALSVVLQSVRKLTEK